MKREEKNQLTRRRILDSALTEFSKQGYGASSINQICAAPDLSKGIIYHYFDTKDDLFLACVEECFDRLTAYLTREMQSEQGSVEEQLEHCFTARTAFFRANPAYQRIFCEAVITPPAHLAEEIRARKQAYDALNVQILQHLLAPVALRADLTVEDVIELFRQFQDFTNSRQPTAEMSPEAFEAREQMCRRTLKVLLYGVIRREDAENG